jgi:trans-2,3-dihydro-3-hydroxyanthranilate isomerase
MRQAFRIVNVFTVEGDRLSGNPLCVFEDARGISDAQMQALARQMNLSETTFVLPSDRGTARVRIFTPSYEMPFAGHPTLGTAHVVRAMRGGGDRVVLEMHAGLIEVTAAGDAWTLRAARAPTTRPVAASRIELARMLALPDDAVADEPLWVNTGVEQLVIPLAAPAHVRAARPIRDAFARHAHSETREGAMAYVWARERGGELVVRFFFAQHDAIIEDPATGSACANLGGWMIATGKPLPFASALRQGDAVGRPSRLELGVTVDREIFVGGKVVELGRGELAL